jgi:hypothetical protein
MRKSLPFIHYKVKNKATFLVLFSCFLTFSGFEKPQLMDRLQTIDLAVHWWSPLNK